MKPKHLVLKDLRQIPGIGTSIAGDLWDIGIRSVTDLRGKNPYTLYQQLNSMTGQTNDICLLYTFRCAVYFASETRHERRKLNWWYWKNKMYNESLRG